MPIEDVSKKPLHTNGVNSNHVEANQSRMKIKKDERFNQGKLDSVDISEEARSLEQTVTNLKANASKMPDVRVAKMEEIAAKLKNDFYDKPEVIEQVAKKVADVFSAKKLEF